MAAVTVYGAAWSAETTRACELLEVLRVPYQYSDVDDDESARRKIEAASPSGLVIPTILLKAEGEEIALAAPSDSTLEEELGKRGLLPLAPALRSAKGVDPTGV